MKRVLLAKVAVVAEVAVPAQAVDEAGMAVAVAAEAAVVRAADVTNGRHRACAAGPLSSLR